MTETQLWFMLGGFAGGILLMAFLFIGQVCGLNRRLYASEKEKKALRKRMIQVQKRLDETQDIALQLREGTDIHRTDMTGNMLLRWHDGAEKLLRALEWANQQLDVED